MKAVAFFVQLTSAQIRDLNEGGGWDSEVGKAYLAARDGALAEAVKLGMLRPAARLDADDAEAVWTALQNFDNEKGWCRNPAIECLTSSPRSMDMGDVVMWEDGRVETVAAIGFRTIDLALPAVPA